MLRRELYRLANMPLRPPYHYGGRVWDVYLPHARDVREHSNCAQHLAEHERNQNHTPTHVGCCTVLFFHYTTFLRYGANTPLRNPNRYYGQGHVYGTFTHVQI